MSRLRSAARSEDDEAAIEGLRGLLIHTAEGCARLVRANRDGGYPHQDYERRACLAIALALLL